MEKIRIITDSGSDILAPCPENLTVIPLTIHFGQEEYRDGQDLSQPLTRAQAAELLLSAMEVLEFRESTW